MKDKTRERVQSLPDTVWDCERCGSENSMQTRRSSLNKQFYADDVGLKCENCRFYATHGIPFEDPYRFEEELAARDGRVIDFTEDENTPSRELLENLGYLAKSKEV